MGFLLVRQSEPGVGAQYPLDEDSPGELILGRDPSSRVTLDPIADSAASFFHARIERDPQAPGNWVVVDLDSKNGTYVDGVQVRGQAALTRGCRLMLGIDNGENGPEFLFEAASDGQSPAAPAAASSVPEVSAPPPVPPAVAAPAAQAQSPESTPTPPAPPLPPPLPQAAFGAQAGEVQSAEPPPGPPPPPLPPLPPEGTAPAGPAPAPENRPPAPPQGSHWWENKLPGVPAMPADGSRMVLPRSVDVRGPRGKLIVWGTAGGAVLLTILAVVWANYGSGGGPRDPESLRRAYAASMFRTEVAWRLMDSESSRAAAHWHALIPFPAGDRRRAIFGSRDRAPVYWRMPDGSVEPVLILSGDASSGVPIGGKISGTAVAVHAEGFILATKSTTAPWTRAYEWTPDSVPGLLIDSRSRQIEILDRPPGNWVPQNARAALDSPVSLESAADGSLPIVKPVWEGKIDAYRVSRSGGAWLDANPAATSDHSPLTVAKLRTAVETSAVPLPEADPPLGAAQRVVVLSFEAGTADAAPKATECQILKAEIGGSTGTEFPALTGAAFRPDESGAAVFDTQGRFSGLLRVSQRSGQPVFEVVPIRYGRELLQAGR